MANMNLNVNMDNLTEEERNQLLALVEKATKKKPKAWKPDIDEEYYNIIGNCNGFSCYKWDNGDCDNFLYSIGNCFKTKEEAKFTIEKLKVIAELKRFAQEHNNKEIDWMDFSQKKYNIMYEFMGYELCKEGEKTGYFDIGINMECKSNDIYFTSEEIAQQAIEAIGEDRIKKYYFEVED